MELAGIHPHAAVPCGFAKMANRTTYHDLGFVFAKEYGDLTNRKELIGHARVEMTLNTYAHVLPDMLQQAAATMGALLHG